MVAMTKSVCKELGCNKSATSGGLCASHGGGRLCQYPGCTKGYQRGGFCRKHGGGSRCTVPFCQKVDAGRGLCRSHGGGKRCTAPECTKADVGGGFCTFHGGGKRCQFPSCDKNSQGGGFCRAHGGGRRCTEPGCSKMAKGSAGKCPEHGGPPMCKTPSCRRMARTKAGFCFDHGENAAELEGSPSECSTSSSFVATADEIDLARPRMRAHSLFNDTGMPEVDMPMTSQNVAIVYRRLLIQAQLLPPWTEARVMAVLKGEPNVRSVHVLGYRHNVSKQPRASVCFVVRGGMTAATVAATFQELQMRCTVLEDSIVDSVDVLVESVFDVNGMMCMANCGNTVLRAVQNLMAVEEAFLEFEAAQVIVVSHNASAHTIISCLQAVGFEANHVSTQTIVPQLRFQLELASKRRVTTDHIVELKTILSHVEGVEGITYVPGPPDDLLVCGFFDPTELVLVASTHGILLTTSSTAASASATSTASSVNADAPHDCTVTCPESGCVKYRTTMAHTAALAVGWAVPGCGMAFGYECTCGDMCKCAGCPTHNPGSLTSLT